MQDRLLQKSLVKKYNSLAGKYFPIHYILLTLLQQILIYFDRWQTILKEIHFDDSNHLKMTLDTFFNYKIPESYAKGVNKLPDRWATVVNSEGEYIVD